MAKISSEVAQQLIDENNLKSVGDIQGMLKDMFGPLLENMLKVEMDNHLGYKKHDQSQKPTNNRRNGKSKIRCKDL